MTVGGHPAGEPRAGAPGPFRILVVCTGNICRSPAVVSILRQSPYLSEAAAAVSSAGTRAVVGSGMHPLTLAALAERGLNDSCHVARQLAPAMVEGADLVLTAERAHRVLVAQADSTAVRRTFTLVEFARLAPLALDGSELDGSERWRRLVARAASLRGTAAPARPDQDDLPDPVAGGLDEHRSMVALALTLLDGISGSLPVPAAAPLR